MKDPGYINGNGEQIDLYVKVFTRPNLRDGTHEMVLYSGKCFLDNIFDAKKVIKGVKHVFIYYPETWANIPELQALMDWIPKFYPDVEKVDITTHSVYIIQTVRSSQIRIHDNHAEFPQSRDHMDHLSPSPEAFGGLHVFKPSN